MNKSRGMTLLEVLVALAVFAYAAISIVTATSQNLRSQSRLMDKTLASWVAQNQLVEFQLTYKPGQKSAKGKLKGTSDIAEQTFYYTVKVEDTGNQWLSSVMVNVSSDAAGKYVVASVTGFVEKP
ncbi:type II secretion system minor pseudopilin GspI [Echinimonas agarilytica]|uniref:Type II secretion system protein I n=1 Tax=Echinimonas agarilytica TaxID=1215918 RepID=A0AA42B8G2_9GAMM|nr:type II secretion system minor pseudopilin GspI [Echinimonas agarilytica]